MAWSSRFSDGGKEGCNCNLAGTADDHGRYLCAGERHCNIPLALVMRSRKYWGDKVAKISNYPCRHIPEDHC